MTVLVVKLLILILLCTGILGCGTAFTNLAITDKDIGPQGCQIPHPYSGFLFDSICFFHYEKDEKGVCRIYQSKGTYNIEGLCLIDLPLSLVADTLLLPYTIYLQSQKGSIGKDSEFVSSDM